MPHFSEKFICVSNFTTIVLPLVKQKKGRIMRYILSIAVLSTACESDTTTKTFNDNPEITIMSHSDGFEALEGEVISFRAQASDTNDNIEDLLVAWYLGPDVICDWAMPSEGGESYCDITIGGSDSSIIAEVQDPVGAAGRSGSRGHCDSE